MFGVNFWSKISCHDVTVIKKENIDDSIFNMICNKLYCMPTCLEHPVVGMFLVMKLEMAPTLSTHARPWSSCFVTIEVQPWHPSLLLMQQPTLPTALSLGPPSDWYFTSMKYKARNASSTVRISGIITITNTYQLPCLFNSLNMFSPQSQISSVYSILNSISW